MRSSPASLGFFTHPQSRRVEISEKWIYYLHCSMRLLWYSLFPLERCLVHSGVLRYIHFHFQFPFISHPSPGCYKHTLSSFCKQKAFIPSYFFIKCFPVTPSWLLQVSSAHLGQECSFSDSSSSTPSPRTTLHLLVLEHLMSPENSASSPLFNRDMVYCPLSSPSQFLFSISTG